MGIRAITISEREKNLVLSAVVLRVQLNVYPGLKGLKELLGTVPSWVHYEERERVDVRSTICWKGLDRLYKNRVSNGCLDNCVHMRMLTDHASVQGGRVEHTLHPMCVCSANTSYIFEGGVGS